MSFLCVFEQFKALIQILDKNCAGHFITAFGTFHRKKQQLSFCLYINKSNAAKRALNLIELIFAKILVPLMQGGW